MPDVTQLLQWAMSGEGRLIAAALLFIAMWAVKSLPFIKELINTPRRKQAANALMAMTPAAWLLVEGAPLVEVISTAVSIALMANGINTYRPSKSANDNGTPPKKKAA